MSWSLDVRGNTDAVIAKFAEAESMMEGNGAPEGELADIARAGAYAQALARSVEPAEIEISAGGSWTAKYGASGEPPTWSFGDTWLRGKAVPAQS